MALAQFKRKIVNNTPPGRINLSLRYDYKDFRTGGIFFGNGKKGYVPLYSLNIPSSYLGHDVRKEVTDNYSNLSDLEQHVLSTIDVIYSHDLSVYLFNIKDDYDKWLNNPCQYSLINTQLHPRYAHRLDGVIGSIKSGNHIRHDIGNRTYIISEGLIYCAEHNEILYSLVVKKKYFKILKLLVLLKIPIPNNMVELWVNPTFNTSNGKNSKWKSLRTIYRREIEPKIIEKGIKIVYVDDIVGELYNKISKPKVNSLKEYNRWLSDISSRFLRSKREEGNIESNELNLIKTILKV